MNESNARGKERNPTDDGSSTDTDSQIHAPDLTLFQIDILAILAEDDDYGLAIKRELEDYRGREVNHGRLYPNLDDLVELGLVEKSELDKRTNQYALTDDGEALLEDRVEWLAEHLDQQLVDDDHRLASAKPARADGGDA